MNFVKNETLKLWIWWKVRFSNCEFLDKLRIFAPVWWVTIHLRIPSWVWNHSVVWPISNANPTCGTNGNFPNRAIFPVDDESEKKKMINFGQKRKKTFLCLLSWIGKWQATLSIPRCNNSIGNRKIANARWSADFFAMSDWPVWLLPWTLQGLHVHAIRREIRCQND